MVINIPSGEPIVAFDAALVLDDHVALSASIAVSTWLCMGSKLTGCLLSPGHRLITASYQRHKGLLWIL